MVKLPDKEIKGVIAWQARLGGSLAAEAGRQALNRVTRKNGQVSNIDTRPYRSPYQRNRDSITEVRRLLASLPPLAELPEPAVRRFESGSGMTGEQYTELTREQSAQFEFKEPIGHA